MRNNQPVTQQETPIPDGVFIYSRTDLQGQITEANRAFADISGYLQSEMVGQPHNLIRHPDMPAEAFEDMWRNLKAGLPWKGVVKNRRKDGGFYWVLANASPVRENREIVGYQSVRSRPSRAQIDAAAQAYARLKRGDQSIRVQNGRVVKNHSPGVDRLIAHETRLYGFALLVLLTELCSRLADYFNVPALQWCGRALSLGSLLAALYLCLSYLPSAFRRMGRVIDYLEQTLSSGDLTLELIPTKNDIIGRSAERLGSQVAAMRATLQVMAESARRVDEHTQAMSRSVEVLVQAAAGQSQTTAAAAAGIEQMTGSIDEVAAHAQHTQGVAEDVGQMAQQGTRQTTSACEAIQALSSTVAHSAETVEQLGDRTEEVSKVAGVIKEIADQTNLLALNAAIEAARAGEQGRGFAVVADEVRKLAERTARATQEIEKMIGRIQVDTVNAVGGMRQSADQVGRSVDMVQQASDSLQQINQKMGDTLSMISEISHSSGEQSSAMKLLASSVEHVAMLTEDNLGVARNTENSARVLTIHVGRMNNAVAQYKV
jgi:aerotaxis receptor